ncbi:MAG: 16S rRNA (guanine(527)-N(7))-methyltransferase RsmG [Bacteroidales bacterium]
MNNLIENYFPALTDLQKQQFALLPILYAELNEKINVISRKDIDNLEEKHILHSLAIAKVVSFLPKAKILDVGTGGGFPGIPLAILFPETQFHLIDSIGKKIKVVQSVVDTLGLKNVKAEHGRAEQVKGSYDFIVSRAVTAFPVFYTWVHTKISPRCFHSISNGILYLKGGDLSEELVDFQSHCHEFPISDFFAEDFFETKKVVYFTNYNKK